ncbi:MAG: DNA methyltransferase [Actinobacteria bacterium]|nr:DNA methyltransferase [Actinomycetota bacterium]
MIKYIGSKRKLMTNIIAAIRALEPSGAVADLFSGTSRVAHALKAAGYYVKANDHATFAHCLARCYIATDRDRVIAKAERVLAELRRVAPHPGYFTETFCVRSRFFHPKNGARIDAVRERIAQLQLDPELEAITLVSLMEAADRVDSTTGLQMAYLKNWAPRAFNDLELRVPNILPGPGEAHQLEAEDAAATLSADVAYLDPPYNQHSYMGNYHIWETLVRWDKPDTYGVACKRIDCRQYSSPFNSRVRAAEALKKVVTRCAARHLVVSFNNEGYIAREHMEELLRSRGEVRVIALDNKRYVGAQIGIFNPQGKRVGRVGHLRNREYLFVVAPEAWRADAAVAAAGRARPAAVRIP